jgi:hypothetical protein
MMPVKHLWAGFDGQEPQQVYTSEDAAFKDWLDVRPVRLLWRATKPQLKRTLDNQKITAARAVLRGDSAGKLSKQYNVTPAVVSGWAILYLRTMPRFNVEEFVELSRIPGIGQLGAARACYQRLRKTEEAR